MAYLLTFAIPLVCMVLRANYITTYLSQITDLTLTSFLHLIYCYITFYFYFFISIFLCMYYCLFIKLVRFAFLYVLFLRLRGLYPRAH